ncbi:unnamed protein product [Angiostrongylus costaricensis]|uniref:G protein-coupled receptor n=1 Tax=Angiostrongylus costaricensis TaxID=334426 RepID=A0A0R3Q2D5_ANGCS|nr:unnamed protein product [Angiostrongylus costaricensis]
MANNLHYLVLEITIVLLQLTVITSLPYTMYLIISWNPVYLSLSRHYLMISSIPAVIQLKINLTLSISIAAERTLALYFPVMFRNRSSHSYAMCSLLFGFLLAILDLVLEFSLTPLSDSPNCAATGCFISDSFLYYCGVSDGCEIEKRQIQTGISVIRNGQLLIFKTQANRRSVGILLISLMCVTLPSVVAGLAKVTGFRVFNVVGPFYIDGLLCAGQSRCCLKRRNCIVEKLIHIIGREEKHVSSKATEAMAYGRQNFHI